MCFLGQPFRLPAIMFGLPLLLLMWMGQPAQARCYDTPWFSEEGKGSAFCRSGYAVRGVSCSGPYCDNKKLQCCSYQKGRDPYVQFKWSRWFSEERPNEQKQSTAFMAGLACKGAYCDNLRINFVRSPNLNNSGQCRRTRKFSEEKPAAQSCRDGEFVAGIRCSGGWCDNLELYCCRVKP